MRKRHLKKKKVVTKQRVFLPADDDLARALAREYVLGAKVKVAVLEGNADPAIQGVGRAVRKTLAFKPKSAGRVAPNFVKALAGK